jgi:hypothetical protein
VRTRSRIFAATAVLVGGTAAAVLVAGLGPDRFTPCNSGSFLDRIAVTLGRAFGGGRVDAFPGCFVQVPKPQTWAFAILVWVAALVVATVLVVRPRSPA